MKFSEAMDFIEECNKAGIVPGLDSIKELCRRLGNPQNELKFIHIAGTNGKGSTLAYMSSILKCAGYKTGRYISPTIVTYLERFQVNGKIISQKTFTELAEKVKQVCDEMVADNLPHPTAFEVETAIAFLFFLEKRCDIVVLECGMGGREDATNLITTTIMEVFAHIDVDHMQFLGDSLEAIAGEKAGIIKPYTAVVTGRQSEEVYKVLQDTAQENKAYFTKASGENLRKIKYSIKGQSFEYISEDNKSAVKFTTPLLGTHQVDNAATAILAMKTLDYMISGATSASTASDASGATSASSVGKTVKCSLCEGLNKRITDAIIQKGLNETEWPARLQIVSKKPLIIIDGAHNPDAAYRLKESMDLYFADKRKIFIMGMFRDKAVKDVIDIMCPMADMVMTIATPNNSRAMSSVELASMVSEVVPNVTSLDSVEEAVEMARMFADNDSVILAFGSLSFLGRIITYIEKENR